MSETTYLLEIWQDDNKTCTEEWSLEFHFITDPQEILERIKKFKEHNPKLHEWKPSIYTVKEIDVGVKAFSEDVKSFMDVGTVWQQINEELKN